MGTVVEFGSELRTFTQSEDSVVAEIVKHTEGSDAVVVEKTEFSFLVGSDGAHSVVRRTLGLDFLGETHESAVTVIGDIKLTSGQREVRDILFCLTSYANLLILQFWEVWMVNKVMYDLSPFLYQIQTKLGSGFFSDHQGRIQKSYVLW